MISYKELGFSQKVTHEEFYKFRKSPQYFMPHHPVIHEEKTISMVCPVFTPSFPDSHENSLNDCLLNWSRLQPDIGKNLLHFRSNKLGIMAHIDKIFCLSKINPNYYLFQQCLPKEPPKPPRYGLENESTPFELIPAGERTITKEVQIWREEGAKVRMVRRQTHSLQIVHLPLCGLQRVVTLLKVRLDACNSLFSHFHGGRNLLIVKSWIEVSLLLEGDTSAKLQDHSLHAGVDTAGVASTAEGSKNVSFLRSHRTKIDNPPFSVTVQIMGGYIKTIAKSARCAWFKEGHHYIICPLTLCNLDHILQGCIRSKKLIIEIENDSQSMLTQSIQRQGFTTHIGCVVPFRDICIRPNILAVRGECLVVEEPIIVTDKGMLTYYEDEKLS
ncbi:unnamed protein product [Lepeophtheirus salmonis]|uniref:(salmon louse) hypothetical protein n=1 Tax=Lepeophtheirus salmonis TaxID=72036 RepID=A0A817FFC8_LEPSM|nr:unnamed protein product [Lepeophtheirus salmonis]